MKTAMLAGMAAPMAPPAPTVVTSATVQLDNGPCQIAVLVTAMTAINPSRLKDLHSGSMRMAAPDNRLLLLCYAIDGDSVHIVNEEGWAGTVPLRGFK
jgi:hypothetical protein